MKSQYANELEVGQTVKETFTLSKKIIKEKKDGGSYAVLDFTDRSGSIEAIAWNDVVGTLDNISVGDFVFITGNVNEYNGRLQVVVNSVQRVSDDDIDPKDFLPQSDEDIDQVMTEINEFRMRVTNSYFKKLLDSFFDDDKFLEKFRSAPAAKKAHHAYIGGLAVHTLNMLKIVANLHSVYPSLNIDLLITATMLHDVGKIFEYTYTKKLDFSTPGRMLGHIIIGYEMIAKKIEEIGDFPEELKLKLLHMILSHHGEFEWGSPRQPVFLEALVLHFIDNLDAKVEMMLDELKKNKGKDKEWSSFHPYLEREIYLKEEI
jgi:3'-5' exoribonuclease